MLRPLIKLLQTFLMRVVRPLTGGIACLIILAIVIVTFIAPFEHVDADWGKKSNICGSWNNYCNKPPVNSGTAPSTGPTPNEIERQREEKQRRRDEELHREEEREAEVERGREEERWAREAAESERRQTKEQSRERSEFLNKKRKALRSLKGLDFDGKRGSLGLKSIPGDKDAVSPGLKSGTSAFGIPPNPGNELELKSLDTTPANNEPLFSKGTKFSAPVDLRDRDPRRPFVVDSYRIAGLVPGGNLGNFVSQKPWLTPVKAGLVIGLIDMERGQYSLAARYVEEAHRKVPKDEFLSDAVTAVRSVRAKKNRVPMPPIGIHGHKEWLNRLPSKSRAAYLVAMSQLELDTGTALRMIRRAQKEAPRDRSLNWLTQEIADIHSQRSLKQKRKELELAARRERAEKSAQQIAAFRIGHSLSAAGGTRNRVLAIHYLNEAYELSGRKESLIRNMIRDIRNEKREDFFSRSLGHSESNFPSKAHVIIDALQYGRGDWNASAAYLHDAQLAFPKNQVISSAIHELSVIRKRTQEERSSK